MKSGIYAITNLINGKKYIGQSVDVHRRIIHHRHHLNAGIHYNEHLQRAWNKYGKDNFSFDVLEYCDIPELDELERKYISDLNTIDDRFGYNSQTGGHEGKQLSEETKRKISELTRGKNNPMYDIHLFGEKNGMYNKNHSEESKQLMGETKSKIYNSTGFYKVFKHKDDRYLQGFRWHYSWTENGKRNEIASVSLLDLEEKVRAKGLHWEVLDEELAIQAIEEDKKTRKSKEDYKKFHSAIRTSTGFFHVYKKKNNKYDEDFLWAYRYSDNNGKRKTIQSKSLKEVKEKVEELGLHWEVVDEELAKKSIEEHNKISPTIQKRKLTGFYHVTKRKNKKYTKGFIWSYNYTDDNKKRRSIMSISLEQLEEKVKTKGLHWEIIDEELAKKTLQEDKK